MRSIALSLIIALTLSSAALAGSARGTYRDSGNDFTIGYSLAHRAEDGSIRILLTASRPDLDNPEQHLDRLEALGEAADGGYIMLEPTSDGDYFNVTVSVDDMPYGGGGQYESQIDFTDDSAKGSIKSEVMSGELEVSFDAEFMAPRQKLGDLPAEGGGPGALLAEQMRAVASGDREAILATLQPDQVAQFEQLPEEEQAEAIAFLKDLTPTNVQITGGALYQGYAIVEFSGETDGSAITGTALVAKVGEEWRIVEVSNKFE